MRIDSLTLVGLGGGGTILAEPLVRLLRYHPSGLGPEGLVTLCDGDTYSPHNAARQLGCKPGANKADAWRERIERESLGPAIAAPHYVGGVEHPVPVEGRHPLVVLAVDRDRSRLAGFDAVRQKRGLRSALVVSPGNELTDGGVMVWGWDERRGDITPYVPDSRREIGSPRDTIPHPCEPEQVSSPQLITANATCAVAVMWAVQAWLDGENLPESIYFDLRSLRMVAPSYATLQT